MILAVKIAWLNKNIPKKTLENAKFFKLTVAGAKKIQILMHKKLSQKHKKKE